MTMNFSILSSSFLLLLFLLDLPRIAVSRSLVRYLPGVEGPLPFELETGYVKIDGSLDVHLFYYFFKSENNPAKDPIMFWFAGGPGCSGISAFGFEIGPILFKKAVYNGSLPTFEFNPYSWTKVANIVFLDSPVGAGFAYSTDPQGYYTSDTLSAKHSSIFIRKWLTDHPEYLSNPLYIGGDSYAGKILPPIVQDLSDGIEAGDKPFLNLKGYLLGNPVTDRHVEKNSQIAYAHGMGLISDEIYESAKKNCGGEYYKVDPNNLQCKRDLQDFAECTDGLYWNYLLEPKCYALAPKPKEVKPKPIIRDRSSLEENSNNILRKPQPLGPPPVPEFECASYAYMLSYYWANDDGVQKALNVRKGMLDEWIRCQRLGEFYLLDVESTIEYHLNLSKIGRYRSLIYSGDHDMRVPFSATLSWIKSLNYAVSDKWRQWSVGGQVAGYTRSYTNNMTFATIKGGGHTAPEYMPKQCLSMIKRWFSYEPL